METMGDKRNKGTPWEFTMLDVLNLVQPIIVHKPTVKGELEVQCPRGVKTRKGNPARLGVNLHTQGFKCFTACADCINRGGMLDLYNLFTGRPCDDKKGAKKEILERLGKGEKHELVYQGSSLAQVNQRKKQSVLASPEVLDRTYRAFLSELPLYEHHRSNLMARGLDEEAINKGLYRSIPLEKGVSARILGRMQANGFCFQGVPGFFCWNGKIFTTAIQKGFFIPYFNHDGYLCGMQIRYDSKQNINAMRYTWFSSAGYDGGCSASNIMSWGIPGYMPKADGTSTIYATEGALKSYVAYALDARHHPFVAIAGVNCCGAWEEACKVLEAKGIRFLVDAFDADRESNVHVQQAIDRLYSIARSHGIRMQRFKWETSEKGIDDYLLSVKKANRDSQQACLIDENEFEGFIPKYTPPARRAPARLPFR